MQAHIWIKVFLFFSCQPSLWRRSMSEIRRGFNHCLEALTTHLRIFGWTLEKEIPHSTSHVMSCSNQRSILPRAKQYIWKKAATIRFAASMISSELCRIILWRVTARQELIQISACDNNHILPILHLHVTTCQTSWGQSIEFRDSCGALRNSCWSGPDWRAGEKKNSVSNIFPNWRTSSSPPDICKCP